MAINYKVRNHVDDFQVQARAERQWWDKRRKQIRSEFMKELDDETETTETPNKPASDDEAVLVDTPRLKKAVRK